MEAAVVLYWVVQRNARTGTLMTFRSFTDYADAERHKAKLEDLGDPNEKIIEVTIETHPIRYSPK